MNNETRVAVVVIHGIGEQRPMDTLRQFVDTVFPGSYRSKPDFRSDNLELRRLNASSHEYDHKPGWDVDFFELYWAHLITGTGWWHVLGWFKTLLFRNPFKMRTLKGVWFAFVILIATAVALIYLADLGVQHLEIPGRIGLAILGLLLMIQFFIL